MTEGIQKPNCSDCPHYKDFEGYTKRCEIVTKEDSKSYQIGIPYHINILGCLSHPNARAYLMAPVIKELERQATELESREPKFGTRMECEHIANMHNKAEGMRTAIFFIRDWVK